MTQIEITMEGQRLPLKAGERISELFKRYPPRGGRPLAAKLNQQLVSLDTPIQHACHLTPVAYGQREGTAVYRRSACLILFEAIKELHPAARIIVGQSLAGGYHFELVCETPQTEDCLREVETRMRQIVAENRPFQRSTLTSAEAKEYFQAEGYEDKVKLLTTTRWIEVKLVGCGVFKDIQQGPVVPSTGLIDRFELVAYASGFILRFPSTTEPDTIPPFLPEPHLFQIYRETKDWNRILGVTNVGELNGGCLSGEIDELIKIAEGFHEKKIAEIADVVAARKDRVRLVLIAGPSSSGKTTFSKRLMIQMRVNGLRPITLSTDNYFVGRDETPLDEFGKPDFECLEAVDVALFNQHMEQLLAGETVEVPTYDFFSGTRARKTESLKLGPNDILMVEGIHGLNPALTAAVDADRKLKIYISALTQLSLDDHNRIMTTDVRLIRRIVRDRKYRGHSASRTIAMWGSVLRGEQRNIYPFQEEADVLFNSTLIYEPAVLRMYAERFLLEVPNDDESFGEAYRLLNFLRMFVPVFSDEVPHTSILREFIGGSSFDY
ncbi:nucleoside kinase [Holophaga foetida]|uniref:nucleoside kinase n=1 Tax=Holophaga foetida TaxID=35839 RepID=UPI0002473AF9|nr:nucleoside kinase [Holophaga foetida]